MTSDPNQTIVPTDTVFGRLMTAVLGALATEVVVTCPLWPDFARGEFTARIPQSEMSLKIRPGGNR